MFILGILIGLYLAYVFVEKKPNSNKYVAYGVGIVAGGLVGKYLSVIISTVLFFIIMVLVAIIGLVLIRKFLK